MTKKIFRAACQISFNLFGDNSVDSHIDRQRVQLCLDRTVERGGGCEIHKIIQSSQTLCNRAKSELNVQKFNFWILKASRDMR